jgi:hypothetical protein
VLRVALLLVGGWLSAAQASADPPQIVRTLAKEPRYQTKTPKYGLLVFGAEGKDRVWLVHEGDTLYVDRNGNSDLTEPAEKVPAEKRAGVNPHEDGYSFAVGELTLKDGKHKGLTVHIVPLKRYADSALGERAEVKAALAKDPKAAVVSLAIEVETTGPKGGGVDGRLAFSAGPHDLNGVFQLSDTPANAPVVHLGGPLQITFYGELPTLRAGRDGELVLVVGTPGIGPGTFAMLGYTSTIPDDAKPTCELMFSAAKLGSSPLKEKFEIKQRC